MAGRTWGRSAARSATRPRSIRATMATANSAICWLKISILPSSPALAGAEVELVDELARETRLKRALETINKRYDYIIIDCPPSLGLLTLNGLVAAANGVLIPVQCEYFALEGLGKLLNTIKIIQNRLNRELEIEGILLTMYDVRLNLSNQVVEEVTTHFKQMVFDTIIPRNIRLSEAPSYGKPALYYDAVSKGAISYLNLAREILSKNGIS